MNLSLAKRIIYAVILTLLMFLIGLLTSLFILGYFTNPYNFITFGPNYYFFIGTSTLSLILMIVFGSIIFASFSFVISKFIFNKLILRLAFVFVLSYVSWFCIIVAFTAIIGFFKLVPLVVLIRQPYVLLFALISFGLFCLEYGISRMRIVSFQPSKRFYYLLAIALLVALSLSGLFLVVRDYNYNAQKASWLTKDQVLAIAMPLAEQDAKANNRTIVGTSTTLYEPFEKKAGAILNPGPHPIWKIETMYNYNENLSYEQKFIAGFDINLYGDSGQVTSSGHWYRHYP